MSTGRVRPSRATALVLGMLAVVLLYLLSAPAVEVAAFARWGLRTSSGATVRMAPLERMSHLYALPYGWLAAQQSRPSELLRGYERWWWMRLKMVPSTTPLPP